jgi:hypothetical protein
MKPVTIRRPKGGYLILAPVMLVSCGASPVGDTVTAMSVALLVVWVAGLLALAGIVVWEVTRPARDRRRTFERQVASLAAQGYRAMALGGRGPHDYLPPRERRWAREMDARARRRR